MSLVQFARTNDIMNNRSMNAVILPDDASLPMDSRGY